jgi:hypothetical protein
MKEIISITDPEEIQNYIEEKEGVKLILRTNGEPHAMVCIFRIYIIE